MKKQYFLPLFFIFIFSSGSAHAVQKKAGTKNYTLDYSNPTKKKNINDCGIITMEAPQWGSISKNFVTMHKYFSNDYKAVYNVSTDINFHCYSKDIHQNDSYVQYNAVIHQWYIPSDIKDTTYAITSHNGKHLIVKTYQLYQIKSKNGSGWLLTTISNVSSDYPNISDGTKSASFCVYNNNNTMAICGMGTVQIIPLKKNGDIDINKADYTPYLIQILETIQFENDK